MAETLATLLDHQCLRVAGDISARALVSSVIADPGLTGLPAIKLGNPRNPEGFPERVSLEVLAEADLADMLPTVGVSKVYRLIYDGGPVLLARAVINEKSGHAAVYDARVTDSVGIARLALAVLEKQAMLRIASRPMVNLNQEAGGILDFGKSMVVDLYSGTIRKAERLLEVSSKPDHENVSMTVLRAPNGALFSQLDGQAAVAAPDVESLAELVSQCIGRLFDIKTGTALHSGSISVQILDGLIEARLGLSGVAIRKDGQSWFSSVGDYVSVTQAKVVMADKARSMLHAVIDQSIDMTPARLSTSAIPVRGSTRRDENEVLRVSASTGDEDGPLVITHSGLPERKLFARLGEGAIVPVKDASALSFLVNTRVEWLMDRDTVDSVKVESPETFVEARSGISGIGIRSKEQKWTDTGPSLDLDEAKVEMMERASFLAYRAARVVPHNWNWDGKERPYEDDVSASPSPSPQM